MTGNGDVMAARELMGESKADWEAAWSLLALVLLLLLLFDCEAVLLPLGLREGLREDDAEEGCVY